MSLRSKAVAALCAAGFALSGGAAMAHDPNELGTPLTHPFGQNFWFFASFQTAQNPYNARADRGNSDQIRRHIFGGGYRYEGFYAVDYAVAGLHLFHIGDQAAAGFQLGSGHGLLPFRFDIRISFGLTDGMPDRASRFVLAFDFR